MKEMHLKNIYIVKKYEIRFYLFTGMMFSRRITCFPLQKYQPPHLPNAYALCILNKQPSDPSS